MTNQAIQESIEIQKAAKQLGVSKPIMARVVRQVNRVFPHHGVDMMTEDIGNLFSDMKSEYDKPEYNNEMTVDISTWTSDEIASALIDLWNEIYQF